MKRLVPLVVSIALYGCGKGNPSAPSAAPVMPQATAPPYGPTGTLAVSGLVFGSSEGARQPAPDARVEVRVSLGTLDYYFGTFAADANGRYKVSGLPASHVSFYAYRDGLHQPCSRVVNIASDGVQDLELVTASRPVPSIVDPQTVSGVVFERTADGKRPVAGVEVGIERWFDELIAGNWTDSNGRYVLCGLPPGEYVSVFAQQWPRVVSTPFYTVSGDREVDLELPR